MPVLCPRCHASFEADNSPADDLCTCPECGQQIRQSAPLTFSLSTEEAASAEEDELPRIRAPKKLQRYDSPVFAALLSFFFPGLGQFYLQSYGTGCLFQFVICFFYCLAVCSGSLVPIMFVFATWLLSIAMAYSRGVDSLPADLRELP